MRRGLLLLLLASFGLAGCADLPFMHPQRNYVVFFRPFNAVLRRPGLEVIAQAARAAQDYPLVPITITGAADTVGNTNANITLSNQRATAVATQLIKDGVTSNRITAHGIGAIGSPPDSMQASRTATIRIGR